MTSCTVSVADALLALDGLVPLYANASRLPPRVDRYRVLPSSASVQDVHPLQSAVNCQWVELDLVPVLKSV
jgi:hypothetical protein